LCFSFPLSFSGDEDEDEEDEELEELLPGGCKLNGCITGRAVMKL
jgi:hypothetical protein